MAETLLNAYAPLLLWMGLGLLLLRLLPAQLPRLLGRGLYWVGVPLQILALARQTDFSGSIWLPPLITVGVLLLGLGLVLLGLQMVGRLAPKWLSPPTPNRLEHQDLTLSLNPLQLDSPQTEPSAAARRGSLVLSSILGNTGFVGLGIAPSLVADPYLGWLVLYSVTHNVIGSYGMGVFISSYFGRPRTGGHWWWQLRDVLTVPSLWAFTFGWLSRTWIFPEIIESGLHASVGLIIPAAFLLTGMRLSQLPGLKGLRIALLPAMFKVVVLPGLTGLALRVWGLPMEVCLALVLMSGMPTAFASLILAEEYNLDRELTAGSIALSTAGVLVMIPVWLSLFR
ncbi:AEC family transporter [Leptolyngbya sp. FACHB-261]|uniref:AEC family transporter n=1 Tax=Leptolyngbya sp. FACHB-261 TaxID=2692806 RepID=UPI0016849D5E|nr:AEC family transporter [Leptolyngbya sp. FACHB-261]MBD2100215.1 AEC family transporter [Leptolyngbya sp. FACHB-261]